MRRHSHNHPHPYDPQSVEQARASLLSAAEAEQFASLATLVAEPTRARVLCALLAVHELCVGDIALALGVPYDTVSYALRPLRTAGLVRRRREGRLNYYRLADDERRPGLRAVLQQLRELAGRLPVAGESAQALRREAGEMDGGF